MNTFTKLACMALVCLSATHVASATEIRHLSAGTSVSGTWSYELPAGTVAHSYVVAQTGAMWSTGFSFHNVTVQIIPGPNGTYRVVSTGVQEATGTWPSEPSYWGSASIQAGVAGPPSGVVHQAQVNIYGGTYATDEKWSTLVGGFFSVWHGGGVSGPGMVIAATDLSW